MANPDRESVNSADLYLNGLLGSPQHAILERLPDDFMGLQQIPRARLHAIREMNQSSAALRRNSIQLLPIYAGLTMNSTLMVNLLYDDEELTQHSI